MNLRCFPVGINEEIWLVPQKQHETRYQTTKVNDLHDMMVQLWHKDRHPIWELADIGKMAASPPLTYLRYCTWCFVSSREIFSTSTCEQLVQVQFYWGTGSGEIEGIMFFLQIGNGLEKFYCQNAFLFIRNIRSGSRCRDFLHLDPWQFFWRFFLIRNSLRGLGLRVSWIFGL